MDVDSVEPAADSTIDRQKAVPFLIRAFVKIGSFHRLSLFEDGTLPTTDEHQLFIWKDASLREVVTTLRNTAPHVAEYRHPLARFSFRIVYADPGNKGRFVQKEIGMVYSRDILGEPGSLNSTAPRLLLDSEPEQRADKTLDNLKFIAGDFLLIAVLLPKNATLPQELPIKGSAFAPAPSANGWRSTARAASGALGKGDSSGWRDTGPTAGRGSGGHWRGESNAPSGRGRGGGRGGDFGRDRDLDKHESRVPPPRRREMSPPPRGDRGGRVRSRSRTRSRSPPPRRRRYD